jgi:ubiquinone/menaquinone biosynthesis C-methylase UbiE
MPDEAPQIQADLDWDVSSLYSTWPTGPDNSYFLNRLWEVAVDTTAKGASGRVLEVACGEAVYACKLNRRGLESVGLEPSPSMLARARGRIAEHQAKVTLVRGIAETLPFRDRSFDRVLCESSIDHLADPSRGIREMARLLKPDGRLVIGVVNYGSLNIRLSRVVYWAARKVRYIPPGQHMFWDTPVPHEHTFECTYPILLRLGSQWLDLDYAYGVSIGWAFPMWGTLLSKLSEHNAKRILVRLDAIAHRFPRIADYIMSVWKPKRSA